MSNGKPRKQLDDFGLDVSITNERIKQDSAIKERTSELGKALNPQGVNYVGSIVTHIYEAPLAREIQYVHHHHFKNEVSERAISAACSNQALHLMQVLFGRKKPGTTDSRDKRKDY